MDDSEQFRARLMTVNVDESPACVQVETSRDRQLQIDPCGPFRLDLTAWALRRRSHNAVDRWERAPMSAWCRSTAGRSRCR